MCALLLPSKENVQAVLVWFKYVLCLLLLCVRPRRMPVPPSSRLYAQLQLLLPCEFMFGVLLWVLS